MAAADYRLMTEATGQRIAIALENLAGFGDYLTTSDVVNNLTSTAPDKPLSANMGKALGSINSGNSLGNGASVTIPYAAAGILVAGRKDLGYKIFAIVGWGGVYDVAGSLNVSCTNANDSITLTNNTGNYITYCFSRCLQFDAR